jgi:hypothetical protein
LLTECFWLIVTTEEWTVRKTTKSPGKKIVKDMKWATHGLNFGIAAVTSISRNIPPAIKPLRIHASARHQSS